MIPELECKNIKLCERVDYQDDNYSVISIEVVPYKSKIYLTAGEIEILYKMMHEPSK